MAQCVHTTQGSEHDVQGPLVTVWLPPSLRACMPEALACWG